MCLRSAFSVRNRQDKAINSEMSEVQMKEGKCVAHMASCLGMFSGKAGMDAYKADAAL